VTACLLTTLSPAPPGFRAAALTKRELLAGNVVLLVRDVAEVAGAIPDFAARVRGFVVEIADTYRWQPLGAALWHLTIPAGDVAHAADLCTGLLAVLADGINASERAIVRDISLARTRADLAATRRDYNESVARLGDRMAEVVSLNESLRASEERFRTLVETSNDWIWETDARDVYTYSSPRVRGLLGYEPATVLGRHPCELAGPGEAGRLREILAEYTRDRRPISGFEKLLRHRDGRLVAVETSAVPTFDAQGIFRGYRGIDRDISGRKHAEEERLHLERRVLHAQKLESLGILAGGIAHDFNNLLVAILGNAELALLEMPPTAAGCPAVRDIRQAAVRAAELTNQMLAYSGKGRFVVEPLDLGALVRETARLIEVSVGKNARLQYDLADDLPLVNADAAQLRQVVMNLVTNASEAIESRAGEGLIYLRTSLVHLGADDLPAEASNENLPAGPYVALDVADTGCGMSSEVKARLFDPFFTTKFQGRGLGLAAVQGIVRGHGGALTIESEPGRGTCIRVVLPVGTGRAKPVDPAAARPEPMWQGHGTALVIDDDGAVRLIARRLLERMGYTVLVAENGAVGLEVFRARPQEIDFVLLDLTMPVMGGEQTFAELRQLRADLRVILASGYNEQDATSRFVGAGLAGFIKKPFTIGDLSAVIRATLTNPSPKP
jgi:PAS domain S-box-containing protein